MPNGDGKKPHKTPRKITKARFLKALAGTGGIKSIIAERLDVCWNTVYCYLKKAAERGNQCIADAYISECERVGDLAEDCVNKAIGGLPLDKHGKVDIDEGPLGNHTQAKIAVETSKWWLARKRREEFGDKSTTVLEGGDKPIEVKSDIDIEALPLPLKKALLDHLKEKKE